MEGAKLKGLATGLISTSRFTHATPAAWACHSADRGNEHTDISEHMVYNEIDLIFGGGERNLVPASNGGKRTDEEDLLAVLMDRDYTIARTELPCSKDLLTITTKSGRTKTYNLEGVVVYAPNTSRVYVPKQAVNIMKYYGIR